MTNHLISLIPKHFKQSVYMKWKEYFKFAYSEIKRIKLHLSVFLFGINYSKLHNCQSLGAPKGKKKYFFGKQNLARLIASKKSENIHVVFLK